MVTTSDDAHVPSEEDVVSDDKDECVDQVASCSDDDNDEGDEGDDEDQPLHQSGVFEEVNPYTSSSSSSGLVDDIPLEDNAVNLVSQISGSQEDMGRIAIEQLPSSRSSVGVSLRDIYEVTAHRFNDRNSLVISDQEPILERLLLHACKEFSSTKLIASETSVMSIICLDFMYSCMIISLFSCQPKNLETLLRLQVPKLFMDQISMQRNEEVVQFAVLCGTHMCLGMNSLAQAFGSVPNCADILVGLLERGLQCCQTLYFDDVEDILCPRLRFLELIAADHRPLDSPSSESLQFSSKVIDVLDSIWRFTIMYWTGKDPTSTKVVVEMLRSAYKQDDRHQGTPITSPITTKPISTSPSSPNLRTSQGGGMMDSAGASSFKLNLSIMSEVSPLERRRELPRIIASFTGTDTLGNSPNNPEKRHSRTLSTSDKLNSVGAKPSLKSSPRGRIPANRWLAEKFKTAANSSFESSVNSSASCAAQVMWEAVKTMASTEKGDMRAVVRQLCNQFGERDSFVEAWMTKALNSHRSSGGGSGGSNVGSSSVAHRKSMSNCRTTHCKAGSSNVLLLSSQDLVRHFQYDSSLFHPYQWRLNMYDPIYVLLMDMNNNNHMADTSSIIYSTVIVDYLFRCFRATMTTSNTGHLAASSSFVIRLLYALADPETPPSALPNILYCIGFMSERHHKQEVLSEYKAVQRILQLLKRCRSDGLFLSQCCCNSSLCLASLCKSCPNNQRRFVTLGGPEISLDILSSRTDVFDSQGVAATASMMATLCNKNQFMMKHFGAAGAPAVLCKTLRAFPSVGSQCPLAAVFTAVDCLAPKNVASFLENRIDLAYDSALSINITGATGTPTRASQSAPPVDKKILFEVLEAALKSLATIAIPEDQKDHFQRLVCLIFDLLKREEKERTTELCVWAFQSLASLTTHPLNQGQFKRARGFEAVLQILADPKVSNAPEVKSSALNLFYCQANADPADVPIMIDKGVFRVLSTCIQEYLETCKRAEAEGGQVFPTSASGASMSMFDQNLVSTTFQDDEPRGARHQASFSGPSATGTLLPKTVFSVNNKVNRMVLNALKCVNVMLVDDSSWSTCLASQVFARIIELTTCESNIPLILHYEALRIFWKIMSMTSMSLHHETAQSRPNSVGGPDAVFWRQKTVAEIMNIPMSEEDEEDDDELLMEDDNRPTSASSNSSFLEIPSQVVHEYRRENRIHHVLNFQESLPLMVERIRYLLTGPLALKNIRFQRLGIGVLAYCAAEKVALGSLMSYSTCSKFSFKDPNTGGAGLGTPTTSISLADTDCTPAAKSPNKLRIRDLSFSRPSATKPPDQPLLPTYSISQILSNCFLRYYTDAILIKECCQLLNNLIFCSIGKPMYYRALAQPVFLTAIVDGMKLRRHYVRSNKNTDVDYRLMFVSKWPPKMAETLGEEKELLMLWYRTWANLETLMYTEGAMPPSSCYRYIAGDMQGRQVFFRSSTEKFWSTGEPKSFTKYYLLPALNRTGNTQHSEKSTNTLKAEKQPTTPSTAEDYVETGNHIKSVDGISLSPLKLMGRLWSNSERHSSPTSQNRCLSPTSGQRLSPTMDTNTTCMSLPLSDIPTRGSLSLALLGQSPLIAAEVVVSARELAQSSFLYFD